MFDLEKSIVAWRRQMQAAGIKTPAHLDELEGHLRAEIEVRLRSGAAAKQAFALAVQCVGEPAAVQHEFAKASAARGTRRERWKRAFLRFVGVPFPVPDALTPSVQEMLEQGRQEALAFHHDFIGTEHMLLGLLARETGAVAGVLQRMGVDRKTVRSEVEKIVGLGPLSLAGHTPPRTPRLNKALRLAGSEARMLKQTQICPEHVFLGLLREGGGVAALVLKKLGVNLPAARQEIARELGRNQRDA